MLTFGPTRILTYAACLALLAAPLRAAADTPVDASKLSGDDLMKLAPSTSVKLDSGRIATIADLLSEHKARLARFGSAKRSAHKPCFPSARRRSSPLPGSAAY